MDLPIEGRMDKKSDRWADQQTNRWTDREVWMEGQTDKLTYGLTDRQMDKRQTDRQMGRHTDRWTKREMD